MNPLGMPFGMYAQDTRPSLNLYRIGDAFFMARDKHEVRDVFAEVTGTEIDKKFVEEVACYNVLRSHNRSIKESVAIFDAIKDVANNLESQRKAALKMQLQQASKRAYPAMGLTGKTVLFRCDDKPSVVRGFNAEGRIFVYDMGKRRSVNPVKAGFEYLIVEPVKLGDYYSGDLVRWVQREDSEDIYMILDADDRPKQVLQYLIGNVANLDTYEWVKPDKLIPYAYAKRKVTKKESSTVHVSK